VKKVARKVESGSGSVPDLPIRGHRVGRVVGLTESGFLIECLPGAPPTAARTTLQMTAEGMQIAAAEKREALIVFENESASRPIVVGLLASPARSLDYVATVDGRRVVLEGQDEVVLQCGEASITLRRNGRVVIRGTYVETRSKGVNRIKGGSVQIN
jgi:Domain of unknown function (DUF6484)